MRGRVWDRRIDPPPTPTHFPHVCACGTVRATDDARGDGVLSWGGRVGEGTEWVHRTTRCGPPAGRGRHVALSQLPEGRP